MAELILVIMVIYVTMVYGPIARSWWRCSPPRSVTLPCRCPITSATAGFGGMLPLLATAVVAATGNIYAGLWYPIGVAVMTVFVGLFFLRDTRGVDIVSGSGVAIQRA